MPFVGTVDKYIVGTINNCCKCNKQKKILYSDIIFNYENIISDFIAVVGGFVFLYSAGTPTENSDPINRDAYFKQNIETEDIDFSKLASQSQKSVIPKNYKKYDYKIQYNLKVNGRVDKATFKLPLQNNEAGKQYITNFKISPKPNRIYDAVFITNPTEFQLPNTNLIT